MSEPRTSPDRTPRSRIPNGGRKRRERTNVTQAKSSTHIPDMISAAGAPTLSPWIWMASGALATGALGVGFLGRHGAAVLFAFTLALGAIAIVLIALPDGDPAEVYEE